MTAATGHTRVHVTLHPMDSLHIGNLARARIGAAMR